MGFNVIKEMVESGPHIDEMMNLSDVNVTTVKMANSQNQIIELLCFNSHPKSSKWPGSPFTTGLTHIAFNVDNLDIVLARFQAMGYEQSHTPQISPDGYAKVIYAGGPEGLLLELVEILNP